jgi:hypothetical protein
MIFEILGITVCFFIIYQIVKDIYDNQRNKK